MQQGLGLGPVATPGRSSLPVAGGRSTRALGSLCSARVKHAVCVDWLLACWALAHNRPIHPRPFLLPGSGFSLLGMRGSPTTKVSCTWIWEIRRQQVGAGTGCGALSVCRSVGLPETDVAPRGVLAGPAAELLNAPASAWRYALVLPLALATYAPRLPCVVSPAVLPCSPAGPALPVGPGLPHRAARLAALPQALCAAGGQAGAWRHLHNHHRQGVCDIGAVCGCLCNARPLCVDRPCLYLRSAVPQRQPGLTGGVPCPPACRLGAQQRQQRAAAEARGGPHAPGGAGPAAGAAGARQQLGHLLCGR